MSWYYLSDNYSLGNEAFANMNGQTATVKGSDSLAVVNSTVDNLPDNPYSLQDWINILLLGVGKPGFVFPDTPLAKETAKNPPTQWTVVNIVAIILAILLIILGLSKFVYDNR